MDFKTHFTDQMERVASDPYSAIGVEASSGQFFFQCQSEPRRSECGTFDLPENDIVFDLPSGVLNLDQFDRASQWFAERGIEGPSEIPSLSLRRRPTMAVAFRLNVGNDPVRAVEEAMSLIAAVFQPPERTTVRLYECADDDDNE